MPVVEFLENIQTIGISKTRAAQIFKIDRSTLVLKITSSNMLVGLDALAAIRLEKICRLAESIVQNSMHKEKRRRALTRVNGWGLGWSCHTPR